MTRAHGQPSETGRRRLPLGVVRHSRKPPRGRTTLRVAATALVFLGSFAGAGVALGYSRLQTNVQQHDIGDYLGTERPTMPVAENEDPAAGKDLNVMILASDSRAGDNLEIDGSGTSEGMRSDTAILAHISADRSHIDMVSIPRDTLVDIPACRLPDGTSSTPQTQAMFNSAFATGGATGDVGAAAACTIRTVEALTGVYIDHFMVVDFAGFIQVVDSLGGIAMYIPEDIDDPRADLQLEAGCRLLDGKQSLGLARARYSFADGSDISRISRQQEIVMKIINEALTSNLLTDPIRLYQVLDVSTQTLTTSRGFGNIPQLVGLAGSLSGITQDSITFVTMPFDWAGARVVPNEQYVPYIWEAITADRALDGTITGPGWTIAQAGVPAWTPGAVWPLPADPTADATSTAGTPETGTPNGTPTGDPDASEPPASDAGTSDPATVEPGVSDPAASCTKETAS